MDLSVLSVAIRNLVLPVGIIVLTGGLVFWSPKRYRKVAGLIFIFLAIVEYGYFFNKYQPFAKAGFVFPSHPVFSFLKEKAGFNRFYGVDTAYVDDNFATYYRVFGAEGYDPLYIKRYGELLESARNGKLAKTVPRSDALFPSQKSDSREKLFDLIGVKYVFDKEDQPISNWSPDIVRFSLDRYELFWQSYKWKAYQRKTVLPRVFLASGYVVLSRPVDIISRLYDLGFDYRNLLVLEEDPRIKLGGGSGRAEIVKYSPNEVVVRTQADGGKLLFLSDNYYPGWEAKVDGKKTAIFRADYSFRAVAVPAGSHIVVFGYDPWSFRGGAIISLLAVGILLLWRGKITFS